MIENECDNDYQDIYDTLEADTESLNYEYEEKQRKRELELQK